jgi:protocatechuate 3,4-dioxygenase beta subunit
MANRSDLFSRRQAMGLFAGLGAGVIAVACGGGSSSKTSSSSTTTRTPSAGASGTTASTAACVLTPEVTEGPYYLDLDKVRSDITEGKDGAPLDLKLTVVDATGCTPIKDAAIDVWHCDAGGVYSGFSQAGAGGRPGGSQTTTDNQTFLRGTQVTDASGLAEFQTIYPGWYRGRAVHIHMKVHVGGSVVHTGQLFFDDLSPTRCTGVRRTARAAPGTCAIRQTTSIAARARRRRCCASLRPTAGTRARSRSASNARSDIPATDPERDEELFAAGLRRLIASFPSPP